MSDLKRPGITGTPVDPNGPGGSLIDITELADGPITPVPAHLEWNGTIWTYVSPGGAGTSRRALIHLAIDKKVSLDQHFFIGDSTVVMSKVGLTFPSAVTLIGMAVNVDVADADSGYTMNVRLNDRLPFTAAAATLVLPATTTTQERRDLSVVIAVGTEVNVNFEWTAGPVNPASDFNTVMAVLEVELP